MFQTSIAVETVALQHNSTQCCVELCGVEFQ